MHWKQFNYYPITYLWLYFYFGWKEEAVGPYSGTEMGNFTHVNIMQLQLYILEAILVGWGCMIAQNHHQGILYVSNNINVKIRVKFRHPNIPLTTNCKYRYSISQSKMRPFHPFLLWKVLPYITDAFWTCQCVEKRVKNITIVILLDLDVVEMYPIVVCCVTFATDLGWTSFFDPDNQISML
jgi:hypothetical protein